MSKDIFNHEAAFAEVLDIMEFGLVKNEDNTFSLHDFQEANLGNIQADRFENAAGIMERFSQSSYLEDYFMNDEAERAEKLVSEGKLHLQEGEEIPDAFDTGEVWKNFIEEHHLENELDSAYTIARLVTDAETEKISLDNITHEDAELIIGGFSVQNVSEVGMELTAEEKPVISARLELSEYIQAQVAEYSGMLYANGYEEYSEIQENDTDWVNFYAEIDEDRNVSVSVTLDTPDADGVPFTCKNLAQDITDAILEKVETALEKEGSSIEQAFAEYERSNNQLAID